MANLKSAIKANRSSKKKKQVNDEYREKYRKAIKKVNELVEQYKSENKKPKKDDDIYELLHKAYKHIDKAAKKRINLMHENKAARLKSNLAKKVHSL